MTSPMNMDFVFPQMTRQELEETYRALVARHVAEMTMRREQGLEEAPYPSLLERIERQLNLSEEEAHRLYHQAEDELWEYAWYCYTDEWAWFRAMQDVKKRLGAAFRQMSEQESDELVEKRYREKFEAYVSEIDMKERKTKPVKQKRKA